LPDSKMPHNPSIANLTNVNNTHCMLIFHSDNIKLDFLKRLIALSSKGEIKQ